MKYSRNEQKFGLTHQHITGMVNRSKLGHRAGQHPETRRYAIEQSLCSAFNSTWGDGRTCPGLNSVDILILSSVCRRAIRWKNSQVVVGGSLTNWNLISSFLAHFCHQLRKWLYWTVFHIPGESTTTRTTASR